MIRLLRRWADAQTRAENERLRQAAEERLRIARALANTLLAARVELAEMKKERQK